MSILLDKGTRLLLQGSNSEALRVQAVECIRSGTCVVAAVTPGHGGSTVALDCNRLPVFDTVAEAVRVTAPTAAMIFTPADSAADAILEAADAGLELIVTITRSIPMLDMVRVKRLLADSKVKLIGPNSLGIISPGAGKIGLLPDYLCRPGAVAVISRGDTLASEAIWQLSRRGIGQSTCVDIGSDPIIGLDFIALLQMLAVDPDTKAVLLIGAPGSGLEEEAAAWIRNHFAKPVAAFVAGLTAPLRRQMGHAEAILGSSSAAEKIAAFKAAGVAVVPTAADIGETVAELLG